ncbi:MAG: hypothetical protein KF729_25170 [Sandaracinaceae bacterium]|nr:hypothetical protein [Sandaracinaceae bacterium]
MAKVIRSARVVPAEVRDAEAQAAAIVEAAHREAEAWREALRARLAAEARADAEAAVAARLVAIDAARAAALADRAERVCAIAGAVARRVVGDALATDPSLVRARVDEILGRLARARRTRVRVHPDDLALLDGIASERVPDPSLARGDCVVESDLGDVDGRVQTQLARLLAALEVELG